MRPSLFWTVGLALCVACGPALNEPEAPEPMDSDPSLTDTRETPDTPGTPEERPDADEQPTENPDAAPAAQDTDEPLESTEHPVEPNDEADPIAEPAPQEDEATRLRRALLDRLPSPDLSTAYSYAEDPRPNFARTPLTDGFDNTPDDNPITNPGATLGRVLFYDRLLSLNGRVSCASCHAQDRAFTDPRRFSVGFDGGLTGRNSMPLINLRFYGGGQRAGAMFWDHRADSLETQVLMP
ncbi:MAG: cytochrome c peroxidase, partial [Myxococcota bacterium]